MALESRRRQHGVDPPASRSRPAGALILDHRRLDPEFCGARGIDGDDDPQGGARAHRPASRPGAVPRQHEPRDPHAPERRHRPGGVAVPIAAEPPPEADGGHHPSVGLGASEAADRHPGPGPDRRAGHDPDRGAVQSGGGGSLSRRADVRLCRGTGPGAARGHRSAGRYDGHRRRDPPDPDPDQSDVQCDQVHRARTRQGQRQARRPGSRQLAFRGQRHGHGLWAGRQGEAVRAVPAGRWRRDPAVRRGRARTGDLPRAGREDGRLDRRRGRVGARRGLHPDRPSRPGGGGGARRADIDRGPSKAAA